MCLDCGCGHYYDDHHDPRHITAHDLQAAAEASGVTPAVVAERITQYVHQRQVARPATPQRREETPMPKEPTTVRAAPSPDDDGATLDGPETATATYSPVCTYCAWWGRSYARRRECRAYPRANSIPLAIWNGQNHHTAPFPGDHGLLFVCAKEVNPDGAAIPDWVKGQPREGSDAAKAMLAKAKVKYPGV